MSDIIHYPILTALFTLVSFVAMIWLIINARGVARLFARRTNDLEPGPAPRGVTASARAVWIAIILFVLGGFGAFLMLFLSGERQEIDAIDSRATLGAPYIPPAG
ncbi:hypothetical protein [Sphingopyxis granuli]|uniref:hypothetical protein n=1 Tax=Sphingopyxis granuli TaxID=267128 RepID=UPI000B04D289|nr:hypothetical protein [Sphingopyxis granuli]QUM73415.1 hypothetical protein ICN83_05895 [Sphingopyxis granuli]